MVSAPGEDTRQAFLNGCLLEGDAALEKRTRRVKRRAILVSIVLQILVVAALILIPLLGKTENIASHVMTPTVPYSRGAATQRVAQHHAQVPRAISIFSAPTFIPRTISPQDPGTRALIDGDGPTIPGLPIGDTIIGAPPNLNTAAPPRPPDDETPRIIRQHTSEGVQAAMLIRRIEPVYPALAIQTRREGRVELRAIIATDGSIQSLEVLSGDPFFLQSALAAVRQWRYRATILNGQPIEIDTHITVIYTLSH